jgi:hypothetical protein
MAEPTPVPVEISAISEGSGGPSPVPVEIAAVSESSGGSMFSGGFAWFYGVFAAVLGIGWLRTKLGWASYLVVFFIGSVIAGLACPSNAMTESTLTATERQNNAIFALALFVVIPLALMWWFCDSPHAKRKSARLAKQAEPVPVAPVTHVNPVHERAARLRSEGKNWLDGCDLPLTSGRPPDAKSTGHATSSLTWGERIALAPDMRVAYPVKRLSDQRDCDETETMAQAEAPTRESMEETRAKLLALLPGSDLPEEAAFKAIIEGLDFSDTQAIEEASLAVEALGWRIAAALPHEDLMRPKAKRRPETKHYPAATDEQPSEGRG